MVAAPGSLPIDSALIEAEFPFLSEVTYFNTAAEGVLPVRARRAFEVAAARKQRAWGLRMEDYFGEPMELRAAVARLIGAAPERIALTTATTTGINLAANGLTWREGDEVLVARGEFPANVYPWLNLQRRGVQVTFLTPPERGFLTPEAYLRAVTPRTRIITVSLVDFVTGYRQDVEALGAFCRDRDLFLVVDGVQGIGALDFPVEGTGIDLLTAGSHKWLLGPCGTGFAYVSERFQATVPPMDVHWLGMEGSDQFHDLTNYTLRLRPDARRYEVGSPPLIHWAAMRAAVDLLLEVGPAAIAGRLRALQDPLIDALRAQGYRIVSDLTPARRSGILTFSTGDADTTKALYKRLLAQDIFPAYREGNLRVSPHFYNTEADVDRLIAALRR